MRRNGSIHYEDRHENRNEREDESVNDRPSGWMVAAAIFAVLAAFKNYAERQNTKIVLIADEQQSFWSHAA